MWECTYGWSFVLLLLLRRRNKFIAHSPCNFQDCLLCLRWIIQHGDGSLGPRADSPIVTSSYLGSRDKNHPTFIPQLSCGPCAAKPHTSHVKIRAADFSHQNCGLPNKLLPSLPSSLQRPSQTTSPGAGYLVAMASMSAPSQSEPILLARY